MNPRTIPVKRHPVSNGFIKRLYSFVGHRHQSVAGTAEMETPEHSVLISRGFTIIFMIHVVAIALYFVHLKFLNDHAVVRSVEGTESASSGKAHTKDHAQPAADVKTCILVAGDDYARIAVREGVDEGELRVLNGNKATGPGVMLKLPPKRAAVAHQTNEEVAGRPKPAKVTSPGLADADESDSADSPRAVLVHPKVNRDTDAPKAVSKDKPKVVTKDGPKEKPKETSRTATKDTPKATVKETSKDKPKTTAKEAPRAVPVKENRAYVVQPGDNLYRISKRFKVDQSALMRSNSINDPAKLKTGMTLVIPSN